MSVSTDTAPYVMNKSEIATVFFRILIYAIGVIGNLFVIFVILFLREYKKITHWYILQLAVADIIFLHNLPFKVTEDINDQWVHSVALCSSQQTVVFFTYYASIMFLMIMAIDRYLAICHPMSGKVQKLRISRNAYIVSLITWLVALCMSVPVMLYSTTAGVEPHCKCTLQFPKDPSIWCVNNNFSDKIVAPNKTLSPFDECLLHTFPSVHDQSCVTNSDGGGGWTPSFFSSLPPEFGDVMNNSYLSFGNATGHLGVDLEGAPENRSLDLGRTRNKRSIESSGNSSDFIGGFVSPSPNNNSNTGGTSENSAVLKQGCHYSTERPGLNIFMIFNFVAMFVIPFLVIVTCYGLIVRRFVMSSVLSEPSKSNGEGKTTRSKTTGRSEKEKTKATILCLVLAATFTICWLPFHSVHLANNVGIRTDDEGFCQRLSTGTSLLAYLGSAINPYLYNFLVSFKKRKRQIKNSKTMQSIFPAVENTRVAAPQPSVGLSSEIPRVGASIAPPVEEITLQLIEKDRRTV